MNKTIIPIKGMHCRSCEILIEEKLKDLPEIKHAQVNYKKSQATVYSKLPLDMENVETAIVDAGYEVGVDDSKLWISQNPKEYWDLISSFAILLVLYLIGKKFGLFNINVGSTSNPSGLLVVLLIGLTAGLSTCMAMVGGLILSVSARFSEKHPEATPIQKFRPHLFFNLGRIGSYFLLGGIIGLVGKAFQLSGPTLGILTILVGIVMLVMGLQLTELFPRLSNGGLTLPAGISKFLGLKKHRQKEYSHANSILVGALTFFLPCGFTQAMQLYAMSTGNFFSGALIMGVFALGTAPGLLGVGGLTSVLKGVFAKKFFKFTGMLVISLAIFNLSNGWNLTGWKNVFAASGKSTIVIDDPNVKLVDGFQIVSMTQTATGYTPNLFTIRQGIPVKWIIDSEDSGSCSSSIIASKINIQKFLSLGENTIEFTPKDIGEIRFSCVMGMYSGRFNVVTNDQSSKPTSQADTPKSPNPSIDPGSVNSPTQDSPAVAPTSPDNSISDNSDVQIIKTNYGKASYSDPSDINPSTFNVAAGKPVRMEVAVTADGEGCMSSFMIPGLVDQPKLLKKGQNLVFDFTPQKGSYTITCAMGVPRGKIIAS